jgi:hypothetical protein
MFAWSREAENWFVSAAASRLGSDLSVVLRGQKSIEMMEFLQ